MNRQPATSFLRMCSAEPFRIFFPLATLFGISGVSLWPLFFLGIHKFYPGIMHARMMIEGFMGGYILGFLGTAMPKLISAPPLRAGELWTLVGLHVLCTGLHIGHQVLAGDLVYAALMLTFAGFMASRLRAGKEIPPPGFVLVALGYFAGLGGVLLWSFGGLGWVPSQGMILGGLWLNQAFVLMLVMGVGSFLLPRFLSLPGMVLMADERKVSHAWLRRALVNLAAGLLILGSFIVEAVWPDFAPSVVLLRVFVVAGYLLLMIPFYKAPSPMAPVPLAINLSLIALLVGIVMPFFWPGQRVAALHVIFLGGFTLVTFTVATRVVLGHSGNSHLFSTGLPSLRIATGLLIVATVLRAVFDFLPSRIAGLNWASYLWMAAAILWAWAILPKVRIPDVPEKAGCPSRSRRGRPGAT